MKLDGHRTLIILITVMVIFIAAFMANEPRNKSKGGQRHIVEGILAKAMAEIKASGSGPGMYSGDGYKYEILKNVTDENIAGECVDRIGSYYDENDDSYVFFRQFGKGGGEKTYVRIIIKRDFWVDFHSFINSKKSVVLMTILLLAAISLYFIFASYNHSIKAEIESQKYQSMQKLARGLAHEIRNPLNAMHLSLQLIGDSRVAWNQAEVNECLDIIKDEIKRLDDTVERFMRYSKEINLNRETIDINSIVEKITKVTAPLFEQKKASLSFVTGGGNIFAFADETLIHQTILNIVKNAAEAIIEGGTASINTSVSADAKSAIIEISNDGPRIAEKNLPKIFDFYFTTKVEGSGIGLALGKKVIEAHGGKISVKSSDKQTTFTIEIPRGA